VRVWFAGGGTGGHLYPALAIAKALVEARPDVQPFFIGARRGIEREVLPGTAFPHVLLELHPLYRSSVWRNWLTVTGGMRAWRELSALARKAPPAVIVATGGYAAGLAILHGVIHRVPVVLQEQNSMPGLTTRFFSRWARQIHLGFPEAASVLHPRSDTVVRDSGNPIQPPPEFSSDDRLRARDRWRLGESGEPVLLAFGGSQGARGVNAAVARLVSDGLPDDLRLLWITGRAEHAQYEAMDGERVRVLPFTSEMPLAYAAVDLAIARAGAMSTAEMCAWGIPAVLVPLPTAAADHQTTNARALERAGAATVILQRDLTPDRLREVLTGLLRDRARLAAMSSAARARARPHAAARIAADIAALIPSK
jgi:UDP-N-acetylglucosamine--N-acetylmuramyl-(pentapeptide) pyrophosphoryl-undecaprenol N-acetylglucosamine transferase